MYTRPVAGSITADWPPPRVLDIVGVTVAGDGQIGDALPQLLEVLLQTDIFPSAPKYVTSWLSGVTAMGICSLKSVFGPTGLSCFQDSFIELERRGVRSRAKNCRVDCWAEPSGRPPRM